MNTESIILIHNLLKEEVKEAKATLGVIDSFYAKTDAPIVDHDDLGDLRERAVQRLKRAETTYNDFLSEDWNQERRNTK